MAYYDDYTDLEGKEFLGELELEYEPWQFSLVGVWRGKDGFYLSTDSGCSCPTPWENLSDESSLTGPLTPEQAREEITNLWNVAGEDFSRTRKTAWLAEFLERVK